MWILCIVWQCSQDMMVDISYVDTVYSLAVFTCYDGRHFIITWLCFFIQLTMSMTDSSNKEKDGSFLLHCFTLLFVV